MRVLFGMAFLALALQGCNSGDQAPAQNWPLKQVFDKNASIINLGKQSVAEVCPDNDCFTFAIPDEKALDVAHDFAYLYLWVVESFDLAERKDAKGQRFVPAILSKRKGNCAGVDEFAIASCTVVQMYTTYKVSGSERKFEDGWNRTKRLDIAARFKQVGIVK